MFIKHHNISISGKKIHYVTIGSGPPLLLVHGLFASWEMFKDEFLNPLAEKFQVLAVDLPGFGKSEEYRARHTLDNYVLFIKKFLEVVKFKQVDYFGCSLGGIIGLKLAIKYPGLLRKLSVQGPPFYYKYIPVLKTEKPLFLIIERFPFLVDLIKDLTDNERVWKVLCHYIHELDDAAASLGDETVKRLVGQVSKRAFIEVTEEVVIIDMREKLHKVMVETQIITGTNDKILPPYRARQLHSYIRDAELTVIPNGHHHVVMRQAPKCAALVLKFMRNSR